MKVATTRHKQHKAIITFVISVLLCGCFTSVAVGQAASETMLAAVRRSDAADRDANGNLKKLAPAEHMRRAAIYLSVRAFDEARAHWQTLLDNYPQDSRDRKRVV